MTQLRRGRASGQAGFSMIEVLVSAVILAIAVLGLASQMTAQKKAKGSLDTANLGRRVMIKLVDSIIAQPYRFPYFESAGGKGIVYVACYDANGGPIPADPGAPVASLKDFQGIWTIDPTNPAQFSAIAPGPICTQNNLGGFEVHVAPQPADTAGAMISVAAIALSVSASMVSAANFSVTSAVFRLGGLPELAADPWGAAPRIGGWCAPVAGVCAPCGTYTQCAAQDAPLDYCFCF